MKTLELAHGAIRLPAFLPDATRGVVRTLDSEDLERCGIEGLVMSTFHLMQRPGSSTVKALGGLHAMTGWRRPIVTDSGGFQAYSVVRQKPNAGSLGADGISFKPEGATRPFLLTPEKTIQLQLGYGADVVVCLDDCRHPDESESEQLVSIERTIDWARRGRRELDHLLGQKRASDHRPKLFGVVQGGASRELRRRCAEELLAIGFDGYGYGGWPLTADGDLLIDMLGYVRELIPGELPLHALGVGHPDSVRRCANMGYQLFDSALPTRDARRGRLLTPAGYLYLQDAAHIKVDRPIYPECPCLTCARYSLGYLHHLFEIEDATAHRLATIHNLTFMAGLMDELRGA